jgi:site-specific DNA-methyltransferase (adenine-specific)
MWRIYLGNIVEWAKEWKGEPFHALFCDPPYNLESIKKRFGKPNSVPAQYGKDGIFSRTSRGFMGKEWDTDVAFHKETWEILYSILYPGSLGMAFSSTRTYHRMATAIDNAGFIIHPMIGHIQGQGFPKATRIDNQIDKKAGIEREVIRRAKGAATSNTESLGEFQSEYDVTIPSTDMARIWEGYRYGLQALKPSFEPVCVFQKPFEGKPIDCITKYGVGAFNIEESRIGDEEVTTNVLEQWSGLGQVQRPDYEPIIRSGRWPANIVISGDMDLWYSKFFYCAKASRSERDAGLEKLPDTIFGQSGGAQSKLAQGEEEYLQDSIGLNRIKRVKNPHPTVKPLELCRWLATLTLPPEEYKPRRLLVPFAGSGSEMIGALQAGWDEVYGIEIEKESCIIADKRLRHWINGNKKD